MGDDRSSLAGVTELHTVIFEAATAFTDLRRLQMLDYLKSHEQATGKVLAAQLKMSAVAVSRQTAKLCRRGILTPQREGKKGFVFQLTKQPKTVVHGRMMEIVRAALNKNRLRTSRSP
jgi:predicted ArsR family transcriptional regulator